ncbi:MAG: L-histidine N(alpha)-methyltransferase [Bacteroidota bacterium]
MSSVNHVVKKTPFVQDVLEGLTASPKHLSSKYFYDEKGSVLFQQIMRMPTYYPTDCEYEIFDKQKAEIHQLFAEGVDNFRIVEFGAGDGLKTKVLLDYFLQQDIHFTYSPIDISGSALTQLSEDLGTRWPNLDVDPFKGDYFEALHKLSAQTSERKAVLFLGSNIGNFTEPKAMAFLTSISEDLNPGDRLLIGFDLKKDPHTILQAYDDPEGITREFNLNLLRRINRELGGNFQVDKFIHAPSYDPMTGETKSFLVSTIDQQVYIEAIDRTFSFHAWEAIWTELSQKYDFPTIERYAEAAGFKVLSHLTDSKGWYCDSIWEVKA